MRAATVLSTLTMTQWIQSTCNNKKIIGIWKFAYVGLILPNLMNSKLAELVTLIVRSQARSLNIYSNNLMCVQNDVCLLLPFQRDRSHPLSQPKPFWYLIQCPKHKQSFSKAWDKSNFTKIDIFVAWKWTKLKFSLTENAFCGVLQYHDLPILPL